MQIARKSQRITTLEEWREHAPPKGKDAQWEEGRSAKEVAKDWTKTPDLPAPPHDLIALLNAHPAFANLSIDTATPEERLAFDDLPGEVRNADLTLRCTRGAERILISIEAKADESLGGSVQQARASAQTRREAGHRSNADLRANQLCAAVLRLPPDHPCSLPYQALSATAGLQALAQAEEANTLLLLFHEFINGVRADGTPATKATNVARNAKDLNAFVDALSAGRLKELKSPSIVGPFTPPGNRHWRGRPFYLGKLTTNLARNGG
jgi:hypothetical protein